MTQSPILLVHPQLAKGGIEGEFGSAGEIEFLGRKEQGAGDYPLLSLREQRQSRNSTGRASLQVEYSASLATQSHRISLPRSVTSIDIRRSLIVEDRARAEATNEQRRDKGKGKESDPAVYTGISTERQSTDHRKPPGRSLTNPYTTNPTYTTMADLERGHLALHPTTSHNTYQGDGADNADSLASSHTSIHGSMPPSPGAPGEDEAWGPAHPCFPHMNPYVPLTSALYARTRILRIRRDWMVAGDLAPTFSTTYPELLAEAGLGEGEFRGVVEEVNRRLVAAFDPFAARNLIDALLGLCTGWLWDDTGLTYTKRCLVGVEGLLQAWNKRLESEGKGARFVSLRRSAYMSVSCHLFPLLSLCEGWGRWYMAECG